MSTFINYLWIFICLTTTLLDVFWVATVDAQNGIGLKLKQQMTDKFNKLLQEHVRYEEIEFELNKIDYKTVTINSQDLVNDFSKKVDELFKEKVKVVDKIKVAIEQAKSNDTNRGYIEATDYHNMRGDTVGDDVVYVDEFSDQFKVSLNYSFVQVPTNTYKEKQSVLRQVEWSKNLDKGFKENYKSSKDLQYQYYGDTSGK